MGKKAALHNLGCKVNAYELEAVRSLLELNGYEMVPFQPGADLYVINTCTVTNIADHKSRQMLHKAKKMNPEAVVVAMGCYAQLQGEKLEKDPAIDIVIGNDRRMDLIKVLGESGKAGGTIDDRMEINRTHAFEELEIGGTENRTRALVKVQDGCNQFCTYCVIPYARGRVRSRKPEDVLREARELAENGTKEIVVTGIHVCSYGRDFPENYSLIDLLENLQTVDGIERIRLGSLEPASITRKTAERMAAIPKLCPHFHLSLQSGCDATLARMNRGYGNAEFEEICGNLREFFDDPALTTDVIVGFPGETDKEFGQSAAFVNRIGFFETHVFPYSRRNGTKADRMPDQIPEQIKKERARVLREIAKKNKRIYQERRIGQQTSVLIESTEIRTGGLICKAGYTPRYQKVLLAERHEPAGAIVAARLEELTEEGCFIVR